MEGPENVRWKLLEDGNGSCGHPDYHSEGRRLVAFPSNVEEVSECCKFAKTRGLSVSVRNCRHTGTLGTGHQSDVLLDLTQPEFTKIEFDKEDEVLRIGGGASSRAAERKLGEYGYTAPLSPYDVGVGSLLLGGMGVSSRYYGLTCDSLLKVTIVLMDGSMRTASRSEHSDLFWALCGSGTSFGIVTECVVKAYRAPKLLAANFIYPLRPDTAGSLWKHWRNVVDDAPNELYANFIMAKRPDTHDSSTLIIQMNCVLHNAELAQRYVDRMFAWKGERCLFKDVNTSTYLDEQQSIQNVLTAGARNVDYQFALHSNLVTHLPDDIIDESVALFERDTSGSIWITELFGGAVSRPRGRPSMSCIPDQHRAAFAHIAALRKVQPHSSDKNNDELGRFWSQSLMGRVITRWAITLLLEPR